MIQFTLTYVVLHDVDTFTTHTVGPFQSLEVAEQAAIALCARSNVGRVEIRRVDIGAIAGGSPVESPGWYLVRHYTSVDWYARELRDDGFLYSAARRRVAPRKEYQFGQPINDPREGVGQC